MGVLTIALTNTPGLPRVTMADDGLQHQLCRSSPASSESPTAALNRYIYSGKAHRHRDKYSLDSAAVYCCLKWAAPRGVARYATMHLLHLSYLLQSQISQDLQLPQPSFAGWLVAIIMHRLGLHTLYAQVQPPVSTITTPANRLFFLFPSGLWVLALCYLLLPHNRGGKIRFGEIDALIHSCPYGMDVRRTACVSGVSMRSRTKERTAPPRARSASNNRDAGCWARISEKRRFDDSSGLSDPSRG